MPFCLHVLLKIYINEHTPATGVCKCPRLKNNIQNPKPLWAGQQQVEAGLHFLWTVVKAGIWMGWIEWTGWNTGFFRMSESVLTEGRSWFLLMICRASCVLPTRQLSIKKKYLCMTDLQMFSEQSWQASLGPRPQTQAIFLFSEMLTWTWKVLDKSNRETTLLLDSTYC